MYFPDDMNFQYFFFATYPGFFLQALPIAILAGLVYYFVRMRRDHKSTRAERVWSVVLVCYLTGVICLTLALEIMGVLWDRVIYYDYEWSWQGIRMFCWDVNLIPNFFGCWNTENLFNLVLFLPFGILYPLSKWGGGLEAHSLSRVFLDCRDRTFATGVRACIRHQRYHLEYGRYCAFCFAVFLHSRYETETVGKCSCLNTKKVISPWLKPRALRQIR